MLLAFRGVSVLQLAPLAALLAVIFSQALLLAGHPQVFMPSLGGFIALYFPLFCRAPWPSNWPALASSSQVSKCAATMRYSKVRAEWRGL